MNGLEESIRRKIESVGVPLKEWNIHINYGIKTGLNDAFIITKAKCKELIAEDPKSAEIIRPVLRGRDIKRYEYKFADLYLISTFPSRKYDINHFPAIKNYLLQYGINRLDQSGQKYIIGGNVVKSRKRTNYQWFETQDSISYWDDFSKQKIIWGEISNIPKFSLDEYGDYAVEATAFLMTGNDLKYLLGFLNSSISKYFFSKIGTTTGVGTIRWKKFKIEKLPIPKLLAKDKIFFIKIIQTILSEKATGNNTAALEQQLNNAFYSLFNFTDEEISFIEQA